MAGVLLRGRGTERGLEEGHVTMEAEMRVELPQAQDQVGAWGRQKLEEASRLLLQSQAHTWSLDFWPPE